MADKKWPTWDEVRAKTVAGGRVNEAEVARIRDEMLATVRAYRLAELRKRQGLTQTDVAAQMHVSQRRVSQVERGQVDRSELSTIRSYVEALGGHVTIIADFGDEKMQIA